MGIKRTGDWDKVARAIHAIKKEMENARQEALKRWALKAEGIAKKHISAQDLGWQALKPETLARKVKQGYSDNILVQSSDYFQGITSWVDKKSGTALAGIKKNVRNSKGDDLTSIARVHEFGSDSGTIPARPLWRPTSEETIQWIRTSDSRPDKIFEKNMKKYM